MAAGADGYMAKPLGMKILLQNIEGLLKQKENNLGTFNKGINEI